MSPLERWAAVYSSSNAIEEQKEHHATWLKIKLELAGQALVVQRADNFIQQTRRYPTDEVYWWEYI